MTTFQRLLQHANNYFIKHNLEYGDPIKHERKLYEELGELTLQLLICDGICKPEKTTTIHEIENEFFDVLVTLCVLAHSRDIDMDEVIERCLIEKAC